MVWHARKSWPQAALSGSKRSVFVPAPATSSLPSLQATDFNPAFHEWPWPLTARGQIRGLINRRRTKQHDEAALDSRRRLAAAPVSRWFQVRGLKVEEIISVAPPPPGLLAVPVLPRISIVNDTDGGETAGRTTGGRTRVSAVQSAISVYAIASQVSS